jgi:choline dehydrogenase-like flavoprotein
MKGADGVKSSVDAVVVGSGSNGLVAANLLGDPGWEVVLPECISGPPRRIPEAESMVPAAPDPQPAEVKPRINRQRSEA